MDGHGREGGKYYTFNNLTEIKAKMERAIHGTRQAIEACWHDGLHRFYPDVAGRRSAAMSRCSSTARGP
eukprot:12899399-Prorocentrum_lima.AAC.1